MGFSRKPLTAVLISVEDLAADEVAHPRNRERDETPVGGVDVAVLDELAARHRQIAGTGLPGPCDEMAWIAEGPSSSSAIAFISVRCAGVARSSVIGRDLGPPLLARGRVQRVRRPAKSSTKWLGRPRRACRTPARSTDTPLSTERETDCLRIPLNATLQSRYLERLTGLLGVEQAERPVVVKALGITLLRPRSTDGSEGSPAPITSSGTGHASCPRSCNARFRPLRSGRAASCSSSMAIRTPMPSSRAASPSASSRSLRSRSKSPLSATPASAETSKPKL